MTERPLFLNFIIGTCGLITYGLKKIIIRKRNFTTSIRCCHRGWNPKLKSPRVMLLIWLLQGLEKKFCT